MPSRGGGRESSSTYPIFHSFPCFLARFRSPTLYPHTRPRGAIQSYPTFSFSTSPSFFPCSYQCLHFLATPKRNHFRPDAPCSQIYYCHYYTSGRNRVHVECIKSLVYNPHGRSNQRDIIHQSILPSYSLRTIPHQKSSSVDCS